MKQMITQVGKVFDQVPEDAGAYKCTTEGRKAFLKFIGTVGGNTDGHS